MIPDPLHPAVVHIPIALALLLPLIILISLVQLKRGVNPLMAWLPVGLFSLILFTSALLGQSTGESQEEVVEEVVAERHIETHEENAELFTYISGVLLALSLVGFSNGKVGLVSRFAGLACALILVLSAFQTGHSGGDLVYKYGAASASGIESSQSDQRRPNSRIHSDDDED